MKQRSEYLWQTVLEACGVRPITAQAWAPAFASEVTEDAFSAGEAELDDFLGQVLHECRKLERVEEDLFYTTPRRLMDVWPSRFPTLQAAAPFVRNPAALANKVYGGRMGNMHAGDGWRYRGRGPIMLTGHDNYAAMGEALRIDLLGAPHRMLEPAIGLRATIRWWERTLPDELMDNLPAVTKRVNGALTGLDERGRLTVLARRALEQTP